MKFDAVRAWKNEAYRMNLSEEELAQLPESPVGDLELADADLEAVHGGWDGNNGKDHAGLNVFSVVICRSVVIVGDC
jgi:mersacidin/lichenicidin family type 2 lantibiotic